MMAVWKWSWIHLALGDRRESEQASEGRTDRFRDEEERQHGDTDLDISLDRQAD